MAGAVLNDEEPIALHGRIQQARAGLNGALGEFTNRQGLPGSEPNLGFSQAGAKRFGHQIAKTDFTGFKTWSVEIGQVVSHHVDGGGICVQRRESARESG